ncbi:acylphosphatase [Candidatus Micrarchaeota archaeon]|nr:acylphosphatase [Candidatus Micrarchaeota archaeon]
MAQQKNVFEEAKVVVRGFVQGVGYRWFCRELAAARGLVGYATNLADGSVEIVVQGEPDSIDRFIRSIINDKNIQPGRIESTQLVHRRQIAEIAYNGFAIR